MVHGPCPHLSVVQEIKSTHFVFSHNAPWWPNQESYGATIWSPRATYVPNLVTVAIAIKKHATVIEGRC